MPCGRDGSRRRARRAHEYAVYPKDRAVQVSDGTRIAFTVLGQDEPRPPVVFINGWTCTDAYWWGIPDALVDAGSPAILLDLRGHGESGLPREPGFAAHRLRTADVSAERLALDVVEVMENARIEHGVLVGHSIGVQIAVEVCRIAPRRVAGLVAVAGAFENPVRTVADVAVFDAVYPLAELVLRFLPLEMLEPVLRRVATPALGRRVAGVVGATGPGVTPEDMAAHMRHIGDINFSVLIRMLSALRAHRTADFLPDITVPTLVLAGRHDLFAPPRVQVEMAGRIPDARIVWFEDAGHLLPVEEKHGVTRAIVSFVSDRVTSDAE